MGMSASQARYLQLTARKSDLEYQAQQICQQRLSLASQTESIAKAYSEGINDRHLYFTAPYTLDTALDESGNATSLVDTSTKSSSLKRLDYYDIVNQMYDEIQPGLGMRIVNSDGKIVVTSIPEGGDPDDYLVEPTLAASQYGSSEAWENACNLLEEKLRSAEWSLQKRDTSSGAASNNWVDTNFTTNSSIHDKLYTDNDSSVSATYTAQSETIEKQDKMLELQLDQITTQQKAIETEMDSVKKVIEKNVESSFKTFG